MTIMRRSYSVVAVAVTSQMHHSQRVNNAYRLLPYVMASSATISFGVFEEHCSMIDDRRTFAAAAAAVSWSRHIGHAAFVTGLLPPEHLLPPD